MKIERELPISYSGILGNVARGATKSFSEILATGKTVASIRSERAFGFGETGIFGAHRNSASVQSTMTTKLLTASLATTPLASSQISPALLSAQGTAPPVSRPPLPDRSSHLLSSASAKADKSAWQHTCGISHHRRPPAGSSSRSAALPAQAVLTASPKRRKLFDLQLIDSGDQTEIVISTNHRPTNTTNDMFIIFFQVAAQFGVTLSAIRLNGTKIDSLGNIVSKGV